MQGLIKTAPTLLLQSLPPEKDTSGGFQRHCLEFSALTSAPSIFIQNVERYNFTEPEFEIDFASLWSLEDRYDDPILTPFLTPNRLLKNSNTAQLCKETK
jgi:hypothetical protein